MIFLNKLLSKVDLALIKLIRITKAKAGLKKVTKDLQKSLNLEERLLSTPLLRPAGFPPHTTQVALILYAKDLDKVADIMAGQPQCRLEHIALVDAEPDSPPRVPFADANGSRSVPVGNLESVTKHPHLEYIFHQSQFERFAYMRAGKTLHECGFHGACYIASPPTGIGALYLPHHHITWKKQFAALHAMLADTASKQTLAQIIKARTTGNTGYYRQSAYPEHFHPSVPVRPGAVVFDAGVAGSRPLLAFAKLAGAKGRVYAFEPDPGSYAQAKQRLQDHGNVTLLPFGLWSAEREPPFLQAKGGGSLIAPGCASADSVQAPMTTVDTFMLNQGIEKLDFIKMDIEGAEMNALEGAVETLNKHKPNLSICLFHKETDLITIPNFIQKLNLGYNMYLGHHSPLSHDTILYATAR